MDVFGFLVFWKNHNLLCGESQETCCKIIWDFVKNFLDITNQDFMKGNWKYSKSCILSYIMSDLCHIWTWNRCFWIFGFLEKSQPALRGVTGDLLQNNLRFCKKISWHHKSRFHKSSEMTVFGHFPQICEPHKFSATCPQSSKIITKSPNMWTFRSQSTCWVVSCMSKFKSVIFSQNQPYAYCFSFILYSVYVLSCAELWLSVWWL